MRCVYLVEKSGHNSPKLWSGEISAQCPQEGRQGGGVKGAYDKRQPQHLCRVGGVRSHVYLLMKSGHPPVGVWQNRYTTRACTLPSGGGGGPCIYKTLHLIVTMFFKTK